MRKSDFAIVILATGVVGLAFAGAGHLLEWTQAIAGMFLLATAIRDIIKA